MSTFGKQQPRLYHTAARSCDNRGFGSSMASLRFMARNSSQYYGSPGACVVVYFAHTVDFMAVKYCAQNIGSWEINLSPQVEGSAYGIACGTK